MYKIFLVVSLLLTLGQQEQINKKNNILGDEIDDLQKFLYDSTSMQGSTVENQGKLIKKPCAKIRSESNGNQPREPTSYDQPETNEELLQYADDTEKIPEKIQKNSGIQKSSVGKLGCKFRSNQNDKAKNLLQDKINDKIDATARNADEQTVEISNTKKDPNKYESENLCADDSQSSDTSIYKENEDPSVLYERVKGLSKGSGLKWEKIPASTYGEGGVNNLKKELNEYRRYSDYPNSQLKKYDNFETTNSQTSNKLIKENFKSLNNYDLVDDEEKYLKKYDDAIKQDDYILGNAETIQASTGSKKIKSLSNVEDSETLQGRNGETNDENKLLANQQSGRKLSNLLEQQLLEPKRVPGIAKYAGMSVRKDYLTDNRIVCFACSSTDDVNCRRPNKHTRVKYCPGINDSCLTKTYDSKGKGTIVIRDCGTSCDTNLPILGTKYTTCMICKHDLCNDHYVPNASVSFSSRSVSVMIIIVGLSKFLL